jgi:hypothetical protein
VFDARGQLDTARFGRLCERVGASTTGNRRFCGGSSTSSSVSAEGNLVPSLRVLDAGGHVDAARFGFQNSSVSMLSVVSSGISGGSSTSSSVGAEGNRVPSLRVFDAGGHVDAVRLCNLSKRMGANTTSSSHLGGSSSTSSSVSAEGNRVPSLRVLDTSGQLDTARLGFEGSSMSMLSVVSSGISGSSSTSSSVGAEGNRVPSLRVFDAGGHVDAARFGLEGSSMSMLSMVSSGISSGSSTSNSVSKNSNRVPSLRVLDTSGHFDTARLGFEGSSVSMLSFMSSRIGDSSSTSSGISHNHRHVPPALMVSATQHGNAWAVSRCISSREWPLEGDFERLLLDRLVDELRRLALALALAFVLAHG